MQSIHSPESCPNTKMSTPIQSRGKSLAALEHRIDSSSIPDAAADVNVDRILASWAILLGKYADARDVAFEAGSENLGVAPIQASVVSTLQVTEFVHSIHQLYSGTDHNGALDHLIIISAPLRHDEDIIKDGEDAPSTASTRRFETAGSLHENPGRRNVAEDGHPGGSCQSQRGVEVKLVFGHDGISARVLFDADSLERAQVQRLMYQFEHVFRQICRNRNPELRIGDVQVFSPQDELEMHSWEKQPAPEINSCAHHLIQRQIETRPNAAAVSAWDLVADLTYGMLDDLSSRLAHHLKSLGIEPDNFVPFCFEKSAWAVVTMLGILKAGGACVGLDGNHPLARLEKITHDCRAKVVITSRKYHELVSNLPVTALVLDEAFLRRLPLNLQPACTTVKSTHAAYVTFTSGTTGQPKGIVIEHKAICSSGASQGPVLRLGPQSRVLQFAAYSFDISNGDILNTLMNGGCVCIPSEEERSNDLAGFINRAKVNWACLTPSVARILQPSTVTKLETLVLCGEPISSDIVETWADAVYLVDAYGPAETTILCTSYPGVKTNTNAANLGWDMGATTWITNPEDHEQLQPLGCVGEILMEGPLLSRGYLNDPKKTSLSFVKDPKWSKRSDGVPRRFYKSGDLGFFNIDGSITFVGRNDNQIKVRGQRVELQEIEYHLRNALPPKLGPVIADVLSVQQRTMLVAFVCLGELLNPETDLQTITPEAQELLSAAMQGVQAKLEGSLPTYMIPSAFFPLKDIPLNRSGKVDRSKLKDLVSDYMLEGLTPDPPMSDRRGPSTELEKQLADHWCQVLGISRRAITLNDHFLRLGGDSLAAMKLVAACRASCINLNVATVFRAPTLGDMAANAMFDDQGQSERDAIAPFALLDASASSSAFIDTILEQCEDISDPSMIADAYPCAPVQEGLLALSHKQQGSYIAQDHTVLPNDIDITKFLAALERVIDACDVLRTRIVHSSEGIVQVVLRNIKPCFQGTVPDAIALQEFMKTERNVIMDSGQPLSRWAVMLDAGSGQRHCVWTIHHAVYDGWSMPLIKDMIERAYAGQAVETPVKFNRFIQQVLEYQDEANHDFWNLYFDECEAPVFPSMPSPAYQPHARSILNHKFHIEKQRESSYTLPTILRAAFARLVGCYAASDDVVFGVTLAGRNAPIPGIETLIGPTISTLPVRIRWNASSSIDDLLYDVQDQSAAMIPFEHSGLQNIQKVSDAARFACQFQSLLIIQPLPEVRATNRIFSAGKTMGGELADYGSYAFILQCMIVDDEVVVKATYDESVVDPLQARRYTGHFEHLVRQFCTFDGSTPLVDMGSITPEDVNEIMTWNSRPLEYVDALFQDFFANQVQQQPDAIAVCTKDVTMTYRELDHLSTILAHHLVEVEGVRPDTYVPLCFEKSVWTVVAIVAVAKAGACIVTMDHSHPKSRLQNIVSTTQARIVLCSEQFAPYFQNVCDRVYVVNGALTQERASDMVLPLISARAALYTVFTSGSTGTPKGVVTEHGAFLSSALAYGKGFRMTPETRVLQYSSYSFDVSILEILTPLIFGAQICVVSDDDRLNDLGAAMAQLNVTWCLLTPTVARTVDPQVVPNLEVLLIGAEPLDRQDILQWAPHVPHLFESYGPSECSIISSAFTGLNPATDPRNIGRTFNARYWITAPNDPNILVPIGTVGELLIEGPILAREYLSDPDKTTASFITDVAWAKEAMFSDPSHWKTTEGAVRRFYRTGDLVHYDSDGNVIYIGRRDTQVKLHGQRIELGEIQHHMLQLVPDVKNIVIEVVNNGHENREPVLVAFITLQSQMEEVDSQELLAPQSRARDELMAALKGVKSQLSAVLPKYMVPSLFLPLSRVPMTSSQKVDRKRLRELVSELSSTQLAMYKGQAVVGRKPSTSTEVQLQHTWAKILSVDPGMLSAEDSFLDIGGDSVQAIRLVAACRALNLSLTVPQIFQNPKLADMARCLVRINGPSTAMAPFELISDNIADVRGLAAAQCGVSTADVEDIYPCTALQEGLMISSIKTPGSYIARHIIELPPVTDVRYFQAAVELVVDSTPTLRTRIVQEPDLLQVVLRRHAITWSFEKDLATAIASSAKTSMAFSEELAKYIIVRDEATQKLYFIWVVHHVLYDGWSVTLLKRQIDQAYGNVSIAAPMPHTDIGFNKFVKYTSGAENPSARTFWREYLTGSVQPAFPAIPKGRQPHADQLFDYQMSLSHRSPSTNFTLSTTLRAAWALLLQSYSGATDVVFGTTLSGRDTPLDGIDQIIGPTIATVPVRVSLEPSTQNIEMFLKSIQDHMADAIPHQHMGIQGIQRLSDDAYDACRFQTLLTIQPAETADTGLCSSWSNPAQDLHKFNPYALMVRCDLGEPSENTTEVAITASYDSSIINAVELCRIIQQFENIVNGLLASSPTDPVRAIELISPQDKRDLEIWNDEAALQPVESCLHEIFRTNVLISPHSQAISSWDGEMTYEDLERLSSQLSSLLTKHGVKRGSHVALCFEKTKWMAVAVLATLKAGAVVVALDHKHPVSRLEQIVSSVEADLLLTTRQCSSLVVNQTQTTVLVDQLDFGQMPFIEQADIARPEDAAVVVFTSGSTGTPKGYIIEHRAMASSAKAFGQAYFLGPHCRVFQFGSYAHDVMILEIIVPLLFGACICIPTEEERLSNTAGAMRRLEVDWAFFTPSVARLIRPADVPGLRVLVLGGEALSEGDIDQWAGNVEHLINGYGPGECSIFSSASIDVTRGANSRNIGKTFNAHYWIVSPENPDSLCPIGGVGELLVEGPILARGYLNNPDKTAAAFIDAPDWDLRLRSRPGPRRLYRTGDLARYSSDGSAIFLGRIDTQVKIRGQRTELAEVEQQLRTLLPSTTAAVVELVALKRDGSRKALIAFLCFDGGAGEDGSAIQRKDLDTRGLSELATITERLSESLPIYMIPSHFIPFRGFPLTRSGKTDRRQLVKFATNLSLEELGSYGTLTSGGQEKLAPCTPLEILLQSHWASTLKLKADAIGRDDSFFKMGGDSIAAIHLVTSLRNSGYSLLMSDLFRMPHLCNMAQRLTALETGSDLDPAPFSIVEELYSREKIIECVLSQCGVDKQFIEDAYPTTPLQEGLMAISTKDPGSYVAQFSINLTSAGIDTSKFRASWECLFELVPILRTRICNVEGPVSLQIVIKESINWLAGNDLASYLKSDRDASMSFGGRLSRHAIIQSSSGDHFVWTVHHALYDAWSVRLILENLHRIYTGKVDLCVAKFSRYIQYLVEMDDAVGADSEEYWRLQLLDAAPSEFPALPSRDYQPHLDNVMQQEFDLPGVQPAGCTLSTLMWAAWALVVSRYTGAADVLFGTVLSGRYAPIPDIEEVVGPTMNTLPIRHKIDLFQTVDQYLEEFQAQATDMIPFETFGLQRIQHLSDSAYEACLFKSMLVVQSMSNSSADNSEFNALLSTHGEVDFASYPLGLECSIMETRINVTATYDSKILDLQQMSRILDQFRHAVTQLSLEGSSTLNELELISARDIVDINNWNSHDFPTSRKFMDSLFAESVLIHPASLAVDAWDGQFTYRQLDDLSTELAITLLQFGVGPEVSVPLAFSKSKWIVVAMLATSKAGGAFVPMDPTQPAARLQSILSQTKAETVLCSPQFLDSFKPKCKNVFALGDAFEKQATRGCHDILESKRASRSPQDAAYIIFTSGSTGEPKGCVLTHESYCSSVTAYAQDLVGPATRALQFASYSFDACILEIFTPLMSGGCVCIPSDHSRLDDITGVIAGMAVNWAALTPSTAKLINPGDVPALKTLLIGGEALSQEDVARWRGQAELFHMYGPTECAVVASRFARITEDIHPNNIGVPYASRFWVVDPSDHHILLPIGATGELLIDGPILARGYLGDLEKTQMSFIENPRWLAKDKLSRRMYKTGDLVRYNSDGTINFVGRNDTQIKLRGLRIQLDEVERHLYNALPTVQSIVVELVHVENKALLVAFLSFGPQDSENASDQDLLNIDAASKSKFVSALATAEDSMTAAMYAHMIPSIYIPLQNMPATLAGKTDRRRLRKLVSQMSTIQMETFSVQTNEEHAVPSTRMERKLQGLWATVLGIEAQKIGSRDSFFKLGGDSILAIRLVGACRAHGILLSAVDVFQKPRLSDMSRIASFNEDAPLAEDIAAFSLLQESPDVIESFCRQAAKECGVGLDSIEDIYPCTALQEGLMAVSIKVPGTYVAQGVVELQDTTDFDQLKLAWETTAQLNPILRTRIIENTQTVAAGGSSFVQVVLRESTPWHIGNSLHEYTTHSRHKAMNLGAALSQYALIEDQESGGRYFVWTVHHALYDGWSMSLILKSVDEFYRHGSSSQPVSFKRYIAHLANKENQEASETYWRSSLRGASPASFPPSTPTPGREPLPDSTLQHTIKVRPDFRKSGAVDGTLATILRAAWALLVSRYTDSHDVVFGAVFTGRTASVPGIEEIAGPTVNTVPVRTIIDPNKTVAAYIRQVEDYATTLIPFETYGLHRIQRLSQDAYNACQFQNLLVIQAENQDHSALICPVQATSAGVIFDNLSSYSMGVQCTLGEKTIEIYSAYDSNILGHKQMQRMINQFDHLIQQMCQSDNTLLVGELDLLSANDRREINTWYSSPLESPSLCLDEMFQSIVRENGDRNAVEAWDGNFTYKELDQSSNRLAQRLIDAGVGPEVKVPLCFQKSRWMVVSMLAIVKAGGAMVPMDPDHPRNRLEYIVKAVNAKIVLCSSDQTGWISGCGRTAVVVNSSVLDMPSPETAPRGRTRLDSPLYVIFTSGSSGEPKGCVIEHKAFCAIVPCLSKSVLFGPSTRILQLASYSFGAANAEILSTLLHGGCLCIVPNEARTNLPQVVKEFNINYLFMSPTFSRLIPPEAIPTVKTLLLGAESMSLTDLETWTPHVRVVQGYGQTECSTLGAANPDMKVGDNPRNVGRPVASRHWIVDASDHTILAPLGAVGELVVEGPILARGYLNDHERTVAAFIKPPAWRDSFSFDSCKRMYKTGDLAYFDHDGTLSLVGRKDNQVNIRGQRVELGEIEHHLRKAIPTSKGIVVEMIETSGDDSQTNSILVAFLGLGMGIDIFEADELSSINSSAWAALQALLANLGTDLSRVLPSYMIPSIYLPLKTIPTTSSGKVDRRKMRALASGLSKEHLASYSLATMTRRPPSTEMEERLQKLWYSILPSDVGIIGADDHFLQIGGDSLSAIKLVSACRAEGLTLSVANIFKNPTLSQMAKVLDVAQLQDDRQQLSVSMETPSVRAMIADMIHRGFIQSDDQVEDILDATYMQTSFVACGLMKQRSKTNYVSLDFSMPIDAARLKAACEKLVARHQILRTIFVAYQQQALQVVLKSMSPDIAYFSCGSDLDNIAANAIEQDSSNDAALGKSFLRIMLFDGGLAGSRLTIRINHAQFDGMSFPLLIEDLASLYQGTEGLSTWPGFSSFVHSSLEMPETDAIEYYSQLLADSMMTEVSEQASRPLQNYPASDVVRRKVSHISFPEHGITFATILKTAWAMVLATVTGRTDVVFGYLVSGRNLPMPRIEEVIGPCINIVPVRMQPHAGTARELLERARDQNLEAMPYEAYSFEKIVANCTSWPRWTRFSTIVQCQHVAIESGVVPFGETTCVLTATNQPSDLTDVLVDAMPTASGAKDEMSIQFLYSEQRVPGTTVSHMADLLCSYINLLQQDVDATIPLVAEQSLTEPEVVPPVPQMYGSAVRQGDDHEHKKAALDPVVIKVWTRVFGSSVADTDVPFYALWGSPIAAAELASQYGREGLCLGMEEIIQHPTMETQSRLLLLRGLKH